VIGVLGASCSGSDFAQSEETPMSEGGSDAAGAPATPNGGSSTGVGGADSQAGETSSEGGGGSGSVAGRGGAPGSAGDANPPDACGPDEEPTCNSKTARAVCRRGVWEVEKCESGPNDCAPASCSAGKCVASLLVPVNEQGDCKQASCAFGEVTTQPDLQDLPDPKGVCDVPSCTEAGPKLTDDNSKCAANRKCTTGVCECRTCPNGKVDNVIFDTCRMPVGVVATANHVNMGSSAAGAIDGNTTITWNAGQPSGQLVLTFPSPQTMTALVLYLTGQSGNNMAKTISLTAKIEVADNGPALNKSANFSYTEMMPTGPIRLELGLVKVSKITLDFTSPSSWIAVNEALFVLCTPDP
jgi:hypothetical protein